jgi:hypothetical protein
MRAVSGNSIPIAPKTRPMQAGKQERNKWENSSRPDNEEATYQARPLAS